MATITAAIPALSGDLSLFHTTDPLLANAPVLIFYGAAASIGATSSRIQLHVFTPAGQASYPRLAISPNSPFYSAVSNLPREEQGDEICRGIAFGLRKYFDELTESVKKTWCAHAKSASPQALYKDNHVAILATRMTRIENVNEVIENLSRSLPEQKLPWIDVDIALPPGTIKELPRRTDSAASSEDWDERQLLKHRFGAYADIIAGFGDIAFLPTSRVKRAPSKVSSIGRSTSFARHQKENVRREILEVLETEESYVSRVKELQWISESIGLDLKEGSQTQLREVFPASIATIVRANQNFLLALHETVSSTEGDAQRDIESTTDGQQTSDQTRQDILGDKPGVGAFAKCLCECVPNFKECYISYMKSHAEANQLLRSLLRSSDPTVLTAIQEIGEQKLISLLIEPVQRLPRYSLYIDNISKQLPARHPALKYLLKARDTITEICSQDEAESANVEGRLRDRITGWLTDSSPLGRLVTAVDYTELAPPYALERSVIQYGMLLLFNDSVIFLERHGNSATSARGLLTELDAPPTQRQTQNDLVFVKRVGLHLFDCTESHEGQSVQCVTWEQSDGAGAKSTRTAEALQVFLLEGSYDGKACRLLEDIAKARVEGRFSEAEREGNKWEARATDAVADQLRLFSAVFEDSVADHVSSRRSLASIRIIVDIDKHSQKHRAGQHEIRTVVTISPMRDRVCRLSVDSIDGPGGCEHVPMSDLVTILRRKLAQLVASRSLIHRSGLTNTLLSHNSEVLQSIELQAAEDDKAEVEAVKKAQSPKRQRSNTLRPLSPVKMLSNLLSSTGPGSQAPSLKREPSATSIPSLGAAPNMPPPNRSTANMPKPPSRESRPNSKDQSTPKSIAASQPQDSLPGHLMKLEDTMSAYVLALKARKGNIVGRSLKMRATANELAVSELYNTLLENHQMMVIAAQAPVDVLFAAFEKFVNIAWREQVGQVMPSALLQDIQAKAETIFPTDFDEYCRSTLATLPQQNQRAFKAIINLLHDLLDGTGNDADRGALTAAFAELLVTEGNPQEFIALIDRFVDDSDTYFGEPIGEAQNATDESFNPAYSHKRSRSVNTGSLSSNTSSLRKKFGFGSLSRENSKSEQDSKVAAVWRSLSKGRTGDASPAGSISRGTLHRANSTDSDGRVFGRPTSQEGPMSRRNVSTDALAALAPPTQNPGLSTIGEHPTFIPTGPPRKKRRSSLSDLKMLEAPFVTPQRPSRLPGTQKDIVDKSLPASPIPSTPSSKGGSLRIHSPSRVTPRPPLPASFRNENSPGAAKSLGQSPPRLKLQSDGQEGDEIITITATSPSVKPRPTSNIPTLSLRASSPSKVPPPVTPVRNGLSERFDAGNIVKNPSPQHEKAISTPTVKAAGSPTKKLRMQSPQKLRERMQTEQAAIAAAHSSLQDELGKIGDELSSTPSRLTSRVGGTHGSLPRTTPAGRTGVDLAAKVLKMEASLPEHITTLTSKLERIQSDVSSSLAVSENKCKELDKLYREANAENEALYSRFNDELARVLKIVKGGDGVEELKRRLKEQEEEVGRLKRENGRLKREVTGLRAQLRD